MKQLANLARNITLAGLIAVATTAPADAQFFSKKALTMVVNYGAGGNADISARIFQKYLARYVAGSPTIVIQDMPGAGGYTAMNMLGLSISFKADGLTAGFFGLSPPGLIAQDPGLKVTMRDFAIIGAVRDWNVAYARKDIAPGLTKPEDIVKAKEIYAGGYARANINDARSSLALEVLGIPYKMITGFQGTADLNKALLQNEINFVNSALPGYVKQAIPQIIEPGIGIPLFYFPVSGTDGRLTQVSSLERLGVPAFPEVYRRIFGSAPSGPKFDALLLMCDLDSAMHGVIVLPKAAPPEAVTALRDAFSHLAADEEFQAEYEKTSGEKPVLVSAQELEPLLARFNSASPEVRDIFKAMVGP